MRKSIYICCLILVFSLTSKSFCAADNFCLAPKSNFVKNLLYKFNAVFYALEDYAVNAKKPAQRKMLENMKQWLMELNTYLISGALPHNTAIEVLSDQEIKSLKKDVAKLKWQNASTITAAENLRNPFKQQSPEDKFQEEDEDFQTEENQRNYQLNQAAVRKDMLYIIRDIMTADLKSGRKLRKRLALAHKKLLLGENGDTPYFPITLLRLKNGNYDLKYLKKIAGKHTGKYGVKDFDGLLFLIKSQLDETRKTRFEMSAITDIYSRFIRRDADFGYAHASYVFEFGNNSLFMNLLNTMLKLKNIPSVSHYHFDHKSVVITDLYDNLFGGFLAADLTLEEILESLFQMAITPGTSNADQRELFKGLAFRTKLLQRPVDFVINERTDIHISA